MIRFYLSIICIVVSIPSFSIEERNLLTTACPKSLIKEILIKDHAWVPYPAFNDRSSWEKIPQSLRLKYIEAGEKYLNYEWPTVRATEYLEFFRTGNRTAMERPQGQRMDALQTLAIAELIEGKGRFMDDIVNGVFSFCEQTTWALSAVFYMYHRWKTTMNTDLDEINLPDIEDPIIDLWVGEMATNLSWIWYFFHKEFDKISPVISYRLKNELTNRVLIPFYERNDHNWLRMVNNWNPWCNYNVLTCILLIEDDPVKKTEAVYKTMTSVDLFFNFYHDDGGCDEGPGYWGHAGGKAFDYLNLLYAASNGGISIFSHPLIKEIGRYIYRTHIANGIYFVNFADASAKIVARAGAIYRYGQKIDDTPMTAFGAFLLSQTNFGNVPETGVLGDVLENLFGLDGWQHTPKAVPLISEYYYPGLQVFIARDKAGTTDGFYIAGKGGHNGDSHNHNDVGSCILFFNGNPVLVDAGVGTYTSAHRGTTGERRYQIWTMQSTYHNLPIINGFAQHWGKEYAAKNSKFEATKTKVSFSTDIAGAYPEDAQVNSWVRVYTIERGKKIAISDNFHLKERIGNTELHYLTPLQCSILPQGIIEMKSDNFVIHLKYNPKMLSARIEKKEMDDPRLQKIWGDHLSMLVFDVEGKKKSDQITIEIVNVK